MFFPEVSGSNLLRQKIDAPDLLSTDFSIVLIAFQQWQQERVDTWLPFLERLEFESERVRYYEMPVIKKMNVLARTFINEGMRAGIPNPKARERTITLYVDKTEFRRSLDLPHEDDIYTFLVDCRGAILWRSVGAFSPEKGEALKQIVYDSTEHSVS